MVLIGHRIGRMRSPVPAPIQCLPRNGKKWGLQHEPTSAGHRAHLPAASARQRHGRSGGHLRARRSGAFAIFGHDESARFLSQAGAGVEPEPDHADRPSRFGAACARQRARGGLLPLRLDAEGRQAARLQLRGRVRFQAGPGPHCQHAHRLRHAPAARAGGGQVRARSARPRWIGPASWQPAPNTRRRPGVGATGLKARRSAAAAGSGRRPRP